MPIQCRTYLLISHIALLRHQWTIPHFPTQSLFSWPPVAEASPCRGFFFFPPCCCEAAMLEEGVSDHRHERMTVKALPGSSLEVIETEFFFQLLVSLLANPSRLDGGRQGAQVHLCRQVGEIVFLLSRHPVFADEPGLLAWQMLLALVPNSLWWSIRYAHTDGGETSLELSLRASAPTDVLPCGVGQHVFGRHR